MSEDKPKRMAIIAANGTLDAAYPPMILASTAAAMDMEVAIFFTFYGLDLIHKKRSKNLKVSPIANPAAPMPVPNIVGMIPGMTGIATWMMKRWMKGANVAKFSELRDICLESDVRMIGCQMTMDVMGVKESDLIDGTDLGGAAAFLEFAQDADITLMM
ncbi:MAG: DsrE/DsrF/DrsH-like family protein [Candidatus Hodarchaeales archaeon]|jgi:peroxiredoxin family protein